ncbi:MAG: AAA family ATPase [Verrucomicrobiota bacterium]
MSETNGSSEDTQESVVEMSTTEMTRKKEKLVVLAQEIRTWQERQPALNDKKMVARFPALKSSRSYERLYKGDSQLVGVSKLDDWLQRYEGVRNQINETEKDRSIEPLFQNLETVRLVRAAVGRLSGQYGPRRLVIIEAGTGGGKSKSLDVIEQMYPSMTRRIEANQAWSSWTFAMGEIMLGLGIENDRTKLPLAGAARMACIADCLKRARVFMLIDEGQHMNFQVLNSLKTFMNQSQVMIVIAAMDTLWRKLTANSSEESRQLQLNRLLQRVKLPTPSPEEAVRFLEDRCQCKCKLKAGSLQYLIRTCRVNGAWAFIRDVAEEFIERDEEGTLIDDATLRECIDAVVEDLLGPQKRN